MDEDTQEIAIPSQNTINTLQISQQSTTRMVQEEITRHRRQPILHQTNQTVILSQTGDTQITSTIIEDRPKGQNGLKITD